MLKTSLGLMAVLALTLAACGGETAGQKATDVNNTLSAPEHVNQSTEPQGPDGGSKSVTSPK
jgi:ABC-type glycerol-3-phosphate transport system substrate-binding protein